MRNYLLTLYIAVALIQLPANAADDTRITISLLAEPATNTYIKELKVFKIIQNNINSEEQLIQEDAPNSKVFTILRSSDWPKKEPWIKLRIEGTPDDPKNIISINIYEIVLPRNFGSKTALPLPTVKTPTPSKDDVKIYNAQRIPHDSTGELLRFYLESCEISRSRMTQRIKDKETARRSSDVIPIWACLTAGSQLSDKLNIAPLEYVRDLANWLADGSDRDLLSSGLSRLDVDRMRNEANHSSAPYFRNAWQDISAPTCTHPALLQRYYDALYQLDVDERRYVQKYTGVDLLLVVNSISECLLATINSDQQRPQDLKEQIDRINTVQQLIDAAGANQDDSADQRARVGKLFVARTQLEDRLSGKITPKHP